MIYEKLKNNFKIYYGFIVASILWLMIWATYSTDIFRIFSPGFPHNILDFIHGARSILPFFALFFSIVILIKNKKFGKDLFKGPLGLFLLYSIIGIIVSIFSKSPLVALYWAILYGSVVVVIFAILKSKNSVEKISFLIKINLVIAGIVTIGLLVFFLIQPGIIKSINPNFLICGPRPYESLGTLPVEINTLGVAGSRPTGWGRYAGVAAIVCFFVFCLTQKKYKLIWLILFLFFSIVLIFARGRTEIIGFLIAIPLVLLLLRKYKYFLFFVALLAIFSFGFFLIYQSVCSLPVKNIPPIIAQQTSSKTIKNDNLTIKINKQTNNVVTSESKTVEEKANPVAFFTVNTNPITLSGRTNGVWLDSWHLFLKGPIFGFGFQADRIFLNGQHAHNSVIQALIQTGIVGTIPFVLAFILTFVILLNLFKSQDIEAKDRSFLVIVSALLVFFIIRSITESSAFFGSDWLFLAPMIAYIQCLNSKLMKVDNDDEKLSSFKILGNKIDAITTKQTIKKMSDWIESEHSKLHWIIVTGMHGLVEAEKSAGFKYAISHADFFVPDGISLVWLTRFKGYNIRKRVSGADLMKGFFEVANQKGYRNFFYGDSEETIKDLKEKLLIDFPNLKIVGSYPSHFKPLFSEEDDKIIKMINESKPDVLWVARGLPKQEQWIYRYRSQLNVPVVIGVGAAFKFLSGKVKRAPGWIGDAGFEWLWRLFTEPQRVWKRVFLDGPFFFWLILKDFFQTDFKNQTIGFMRPSAKKVLFFIEKNILFPIGIFIGPKLLRQLTPYDVKGFEEKIRLGNLYDGGYVIPTKILSLIDVAYSYGIGSDIGFENDLIKYADIKVRLYDHTVDKLPVENKNFFFRKKGIGRVKHGDFDTFKNNLEENGDVGKKILLKLDIESDEWKVLDKIIDESAKNIVAIIVEIHRLYRYEKIMEYIRILKKLNSKFTLVHLHGNNNGEFFFFGNKKLPSLFELTLINNNFVNDKSIMFHSLPSEKDYPNIVGKKDIVLDFWKKIN